METRPMPPQDPNEPPQRISKLEAVIYMLLLTVILSAGGWMALYFFEYGMKDPVYVIHWGNQFVLSLAGAGLLLFGYFAHMRYLSNDPGKNKNWLFFREEPFMQAIAYGVSLSITGAALSYWISRYMHWFSM